MSILAILSEKPWLTPGLSDSDLAQPAERLDGWDKGIGLGVFLGVVTILFVLMTSAYLMRMGVHGEFEEHVGSDWYPLGEPLLLWFNTGLLVASSLAFHLAVEGAEAGARGLLRAGTIAGGVLGIAFLVGQIILWRHYDASGYALAASLALCSTDTYDPLTLAIPQSRSGSPALAFFYLISGMHALHILGGLAAWGVTARRIFDSATPTQMARPAQLCARYWDFMLLVWLIMLGLFVLT